jgi:hypothetical protein
MSAENVEDEKKKVKRARRERVMSYDTNLNLCQNRMNRFAISSFYFDSVPYYSRRWYGA